MTKLVVHIPTENMEAFTKYINSIEGAFIDSKTDTIFTPSVIKMLEKRKATPREQSLSLDEIRASIKNKFKEYGLMNLNLKKNLIKN